MLSALLGALIAASPAVWVDAPIAFDSRVDTAELERVAEALVEGIAAEVGGQVVYGAEVAHRPPGRGEVGTGLQRAQRLLSQGQDSYLAFEFAPAAAALAEAAALLTSELAHLEAADVELLYEARLLEGVAWVEAGQGAAAKAAFGKLITIRPDFEPDPVRVPPTAREVFHEAFSELRAMGFASVQIRSEPAGATVVLDGLSRGITPLTVTGLPSGSHGLRLVLDGFEASTREIVLDPKQHADTEVKLEPSDLLVAYRRVRSAALAGHRLTAVEADLSRLAEDLGFGALVLIGATQKETGRMVVTFRRWAAGEQSAVVTTVDATTLRQNVATVVPTLLSRTWPAIQLPQQGQRVAFDFGRGLLGLGPDWGGEAVEPDSVLSRWWFWTGIAALAGGAVGGVILATRDSDPAQPDSARFTMVFP